MNHNLQIHMTNKCNLNCEYCYIKQDNAVLTFDVLKQQMGVAKSLSNKIDRFFSGTYDVTYFGGEPLLEIDNILIFDDWLKKNFNIKYSFIQSNGMLLNESIKEKLDKNNIHIGISCDGCNDKNHFIYEELIKNKIVDVTPKIMIDNNNCANIMNNFYYFYKLAMNNNTEKLYLDFSLVKDDIWNEDSIRVMSEQIDKLFVQIEYLYVNYKMYIHIGFIERIFQNIWQGKRSFICFAGKNGFSITPEGIIYPCSRFYTNHKYPLYDSNLKYYYEDNIAFIEKNNSTYNVKCKSCSINKFCNQGCYYSQLNNGDIIDGYCELLRMIFNKCTNFYLMMKNKYNINIYDLIKE